MYSRIGLLKWNPFKIGSAINVLDNGKKLDYIDCKQHVSTIDIFNDTSSHYTMVPSLSL